MNLTGSMVTQPGNVKYQVKHSMSEETLHTHTHSIEKGVMTELN